MIRLVLVVGIEKMVHTLVSHMIRKFLMRKQSADCRGLYVTRICLPLDRFLLMVLTIRRCVRLKFLLMVLKLLLQNLWIMLPTVYWRELIIGYIIGGKKKKQSGGLK